MRCPLMPSLFCPSLIPLFVHSCTLGRNKRCTDGGLSSSPGSGTLGDLRPDLARSIYTVCVNIINSTPASDRAFATHPSLEYNKTNRGKNPAHGTGQRFLRPNSTHRGLLRPQSIHWTALQRPPSAPPQKTKDSPS